VTLEIESPVKTQEPFRLGDWLVEPRLNRLTKDGASIQIELKRMDVLVCLAESAGEVVSLIQIIDRMWATEFITDNTLTHTIAKIRNALGDDARNPTAIETIRQRGYRLIARVILESPLSFRNGPEPVGFLVVLGDREIPLREGENLIGIGCFTKTIRFVDFLGRRTTESEFDA